MAGLNDVLFGSDILRDQQVPGLDTSGVYKEADLSDASVAKSRMDDATDAYNQQAPPGAPKLGTTAPAPAPTVSSEPAVDEEFLKELAKSNPALAAAYKASQERMGKEKSVLTTRETEQERQAEGAYDEARQKAEGLIESRRQDYKALEGQMPQRPDAQRPAPVQLPPPPSLALRPFGSAKPGEDTFESLNRVLSLVGLLGQEAVGVQRGFARGALSAYQGALQGWADGDKERAQRDWLDYTHQVDRLQANHKALMDDYNDAWVKYGHDMDTFQVHQGIIAAEHGLDGEQINLAFSKPQEFQRRLSVTGKRIDQLNKDTDSLEAKMLAELARVQGEKSKREDIYNQRLAPGRYYDTTTGEEISNLTNGELKADPHRYKKGANTDFQTTEFIDSALPMIDEMRGLVPKLLAEYPGQNLGQAASLAAQGKLAASPELKRFMQLREELKFEATRVVSGSGRMLVGVLNSMDEQVMTSTSDTQGTAIESLNTLEDTMRNRRDAMSGFKSERPPYRPVGSGNPNAPAGSSTKPPADSGWTVKEK